MSTMYGPCSSSLPPKPCTCSMQINSPAAVLGRRRMIRVRAEAADETPALANRPTLRPPPKKPAPPPPRHFRPRQDRDRQRTDRPEGAGPPQRPGEPQRNRNPDGPGPTLQRPPQRPQPPPASTNGSGPRPAALGDRPKWTPVRPGEGGSNQPVRWADRGKADRNQDGGR